MTVDFNDYFWGDKNNGYEVLYQNMKYGLSATKELAEYFRERSNLEEYNSKLLTKLANKAGSSGGGTFSPLWIILKSTTERLSELHAQKVQKLTELVKNVTKYAEDLHKKHKAVKDEESSTQDAVQAMKESTNAVAKAKDIHNARLQEVEKARKDNSTKEIEKSEAKLRKHQDEYKALVEKHNIIKQEFEKRMTITCRRFQEMEEAHLKQMKEFLSSYMDIAQNNFDLVGQVHSDLKRQFLELTVDKLLEQFVLNKYTGLEKPELIELDFEGGTGMGGAVSGGHGHQLLVNTSGPGSTSPAPPSSIGGSLLESPPLSAHNATQPIAIAGQAMKKESHIRSWFGSSSNAAVPTNSPVNLSTSPTALSIGGGSALRYDGLGGDGTNQAQSPLPLSLHHPQRAMSPTPKIGSSGAQLNDSATSNTTNMSSGSTQSTSKQTSKPFYGDLFSFKHNSPSANHNQPNSPNLPTNGHNINSGSSKQQSPQMKQPEQESLQHQPQQQQQQPQQPQQQKSSRRTTSLLNLFMSNSQGSRDSRESRDSATSGGGGVGAGSGIMGISGGAARNSLSSTGGTVSAPTSPNDLDSGSGIDHQQQQQQQQTTGSSFIGRNPLLRGSKFSGFLRSRREKAKSKKAKKKKDSTENSGAKEDNILDGDSKAEVGNTDSATNLQTTSAVSASNVAPTATPEVDEDGYSIQPRDNTWDSATITEKSNNFYSSSDSDSEDEREERKIHVEIKPLNNGAAPISASVDELRATVENLSLSPIGILTSQQQQQHHQQHQLHQQQQQQQQQQQSHTLQHQASIGNASLLNNNTHLTSPNASNASTPTTVHPYAPLQSPTLSMSTSSNNRYADLGDIFSEVGDISVSAPASANLTKLTQRQIPTPTSTGGSSIAIPRPPSRRSEAAGKFYGGDMGTQLSVITFIPTFVPVARDRVSPASQIGRADSVGSLEFRSPSVGIGSSRGPSPLTIGMSDTIPLAVAFHEIIHAYFKGADESRCQVKMSGDMMISFPAGIVNVLTNNPNPAKLGFRIKNLQNLDNVLPNKQLITIDRLQSTSFSTTLEFNMPALTAILRRQSEQNPTAPHINVDILKYQVKAKPGAASCPFQLVSYWKCEQRHTDIKIDYKYNCHAMATASPLLNVSISVPVDGGVKNVQSKPHSAWQGESNRLVWNFTDISQHSDSGGVDTLRARLEVATGPSNPAIISTQFNCEGTTLSGIEFELAGSGYRLSLVKRRFVSGKYICEGDGIRTVKTPTPPNVSGVMSPVPFGNSKSANSSSGGMSG
ncbi:F-BAR domain only protein 2 isoform X1 [Anopheles darlingi]|uniref:F-BAR domain only protein 2 isoform X1 n=1 Tax=Anopheles darlingi TaxID=43151 RepID=UPI00210013FA|nr:F-BAR domain only protein 2 isoform X1 [Anopheles darlingi]XP_049529379.1 F-BAR domain only protein 2 isoform X1 [Anopheles darlingi]XP_049529381.1 F-BAR domain only protein 2 isoform X1 [Anopheles darlingi]